MKPHPRLSGNPVQKNALKEPKMNNPGPSGVILKKSHGTFVKPDQVQSDCPKGLLIFPFF